MTTYTTSDFSEIHGPDEKPTVPGWYAYASGLGLQSLKLIHSNPNSMNMYWFDWFDGNQWRDHIQHDNRYWFGLRDNPIVRIYNPSIRFLEGHTCCFR
ncbi:MAG TPA: hypothetical protein VFM18_16525 [Methanosarcina sp.]|nr:hypothetical protein [Methanosarcina sp.]